VVPSSGVNDKYNSLTELDKKIALDVEYLLTNQYQNNQTMNGFQIVVNLK
jgi:hypothetical protein